MTLHLLSQRSRERSKAVGIALVTALIGVCAGATPVLAYTTYQPGQTITLGDFVYDDSFNPTTDPCTISIWAPYGALIVNAVTMTADSNGWHHYDFSSTTSGTWPAQLSCGSSGTGDLVNEDRTFVIATSSPSVADITTAVSANVNANTNSAVATASSSLASSLPASIWAFSSRTLTSFGTLASDVWNVATSTMTVPGTIGNVLAINIDRTISSVSSGAALTAADVWGYATRTLTGAGLSSGSLATQSDVQTASSSIVAVVNANTNSATDGVISAVNSNTNSTVLNASTSLALSLPASIWSYSGRTLTSFGTLVNDIWTAGTRTLTSGTTIAADIWASATRTLTGAGLSSGSLATNADIVTATSSLASAITSGTASVNSHTDSALNTASSSIAAVVNANTNTATAGVTSGVNANTNSIVGTASTSIGSLIASIPLNVWNYSARTLTSGVAIATDIWSAATRTLTGAGLSSGSLATQSDVQTASTSLNSTISGVTTNVNAHTDSALTTATSSLAAVVNANTNAITLAASTSIGNIIGNASTSLASQILSIPSAVWASGTRTLTGFGTLAADVWLNGTRTLTGAGLSSGSLATLLDIQTATSSLNSAIGVSQAAINANTNATVLTASTSLASNINANTNTATAGVTSGVNANTNSIVGTASSSIGSLIASVPLTVWTYSARTLTSGVAIATDIWSAATRTLTGAGLSSGSLATNADIVTATSSLASAITSGTASVNSHTDSALTTATSSLAAVVNANTNSAILTASTSLGASIAALPFSIWNIATSSLTTVGSIGRTLALNIDSAISSVSGGGGGSLTAAQVWSYATRTLTGASLDTGSLATQADVTNASTSLAAAISGTATLTNQQAGWTVKQSDFGSLLAGTTYRTKVTVLNHKSEPTTPFAAPLATVYDSSRNVVVSNVPMTQLSTGVYEYTYAVASNAAQGEWETVVSTQVESGKNIQTNDYWEVAGSPAQVLVQSMGSLDVPNIDANIRITNEGQADYEYHYEWCVVSNPSNACGGGDDVYYASASKLIAHGQNFDTNLSATVPTDGIYYFKVVVYYGTQSSGASRQFTTTGYVPPTHGGGGTAGGGGGVAPPTQAPPGTACGATADFNGDCKVNAIDFSILLAFWKTHPPFKNPLVDINHDSKVDSVDFSILLYEWGSGR